MANLKEGKNPNTGKEFLLFIPRGNTHVVHTKTFQTRLGAEKEKVEVNKGMSGMKGGVIIISRTNLAAYVAKGVAIKKRAARKIAHLENKILELNSKVILKEDGSNAPVFSASISNFRNQIDRLKNVSQKDFSPFRDAKNN